MIQASVNEQRALRAEQQRQVEHQLVKVEVSDVDLRRRRKRRWEIGCIS